MDGVMLRTDVPRILTNRLRVTRSNGSSAGSAHLPVASTSHETVNGSLTALIELVSFGASRDMRTTIR